MFVFSTKEIDTKSLVTALTNNSAGALVTFEGWVRNHNNNSYVSSLEYQAYEVLAIKEAEKIIGEAISKFDVLDVYCVHRTGTLSVGELAVWIGVTAPHRAMAFRACQYVIDQIKIRLPIWKKETYEDRSSNWINCLHDRPYPSIEFRESDYYARQLILPEIGQSGQAKLKDGKVLVVGAGGLGSSALLYLASAGVGTLGICDFDNLEASNLHRQILYSSNDIGQSKTDLAVQRLRDLNPFIIINEHSVRLDEINASNLVASYDLVLDCSDNFQTKSLLNKTVTLTKQCLIQASVYQYEGQISLWGVLPNRKDDNFVGQCYGCLWSESPLNNCFSNCRTSGVLGAVPGLFGTMQALESIKILLGLSTPLVDHMIILDLLQYSVHKLRTIHRNDCSLCVKVKRTASIVCSDRHIEELRSYEPTY